MLARFSRCSASRYLSCECSVKASNIENTDVSSQNQIVQQIDDACHGRIGAALVRSRRCEVDRLAIAQQASSQQQIINIIGSGL